MHGRIEKVWENKAQNGQAYLVLEIDGHRYSLWDSDWLGRLRDGDAVEYEWKKSGKFRNITNIDRVKSDEPSPPANGKDEQIVRMSCLKSASALFGSADIEPKKKLQITLAAARRFEKYISPDLPDATEPGPGARDGPNKYPGDGIEE